MDGFRICLSLYACEPNRGSEPGVGWAWALGMTKRHETWILTRANNRTAIETELDRLAVPKNERPHFVWVDLPLWIQWLKKHGYIPVGLYYLFWQFAARKAWDRAGVHVDVVHHITFNSFVVPGVWWNRTERVILGPLGGYSICPSQYLRGYPLFARMKEWIRGISRRTVFLHLLFRKSRRSSDLIVFTTEEMRRGLRGSSKSVVALETAVPVSLENRLGQHIPIHRCRRFVWAGTLAGHKGGEIAIRSFVRAFGSIDNPPTLEMYGSGPDCDRWKRLVQFLGASQFIRLCGTVTQEELWRRIEHSLALFFTSVRDTSGNVALEALALGTPVVCLRHQGVEQIVDDSCSIAIDPAGWDETIAQCASALRRIEKNPELANQLGSAGRRRAMGFSWQRKFDTADSWYHELLARKV